MTTAEGPTGTTTIEESLEAPRGERLPRQVPFGEAFRFWAKLGFISFGGPAGQIAIMHKELVDKRRWLSDERFLHALNYCMLLPGPEAQQLAIYIGWLMHRTWGGIVAGAFFVIPSIFILLALSYVYAAYGNVPAVAGVLAGFKPIVVAIVVEAVVKIGSKALKGYAHFIIAALAFVSIYFLHVPFPLIVVAAAAVGLLGVRIAPSVFVRRPKTKEADKKTEGDDALADDLPLVIDDHAPPPPHTLPSRRRTLKILAVGITLWLLPFIALGLWRGFGSLHSHEYRFFTQAALVTFGGAYAVLAYVTQALTTDPYNWMTRQQAVDGLALAETTPGPLIMVLQFVGFIAAWNHPGGMDQTTSAVLGALVTTYVTFLPCFLFIFIGAPYIEVLRGNKNLTGALSGVTAAVVGVVLNLALVFGAAVIFPNGITGSVDWFSAAMTAAAFLALYKYKADVLVVVLAGGAVGLIWTLFLG
ncbi:MAG TPA: chromate efflux transporter [Pyrinomonadaceae bacterium]|nr:chromate efflux transporter [Pyrinomonadaceae bacterium]